MKTFFKASPFLAIVAGLMVAGVASGALLTLYGTMNGTANVQQSVVFGNGDTVKTYTIGDSPAVAGNTYTQGYNLMNRSMTTAPIKFVTKYNMPSRDGYWRDSEGGIETSYWSTVELRHKDGDWKVAGEAKGVLTYELVSSTFNYEFEANGLTPEKAYSLIYYADEPHRFENWGGNNPGKKIAEFTTDSAGDIYAVGTESEPVKGIKNLDMNLPHANDWNGDAEANYCVYDGYALCRGAKIWLVPSSDYTESGLTDWNPAEYLFETDLITYSDSDKGGEALWLGEGKLNFFVKNVLNIALKPGEYKVKTEIVPAL